MKQNIFIVGVGGSLGKSLFDFYSSKNEYNVMGSTTNKENTSESIFHLDFMDFSTIDALPSIAINHLIITSGYEPQFNLEQTTEIHLQKMFNIHVLGPMLLLKKVQPELAENSTVTFISSPAAWQGSYDPSYAAVKGAVNSLVRTLAKDLAPKTRVNGFSPSVIEDSTVFHKMTDDFKQRHIDRTLNKRMLTLHECVEAIDFILKNKHYTGQILHLNGGMIYG